MHHTAQYGQTKTVKVMLSKSDVWVVDALVKSRCFSVKSSLLFRKRPERENEKLGLCTHRCAGTSLNLGMAEQT